MTGLATLDTTLLIIGIQQNDERMVNELYQRYSAMLFGIISRVVKESEEAENLLQDTFLKIWKNIHQYDATKGNFSTWVINVARNTAIDYVRSKYYLQKKQTQPLHIAHDFRNISLPIETLGLRSLLHKLQPKYKQIIDWIYFEGLTQQEISDQFGIPLGTVKTRTRAAMMELKNYFN